jgi:hypothetical protein
MVKKSKPSHFQYEPLQLQGVQGTASHEVMQGMTMWSRAVQGKRGRCGTGED